jgi:hypothetical protein
LAGDILAEKGEEIEDDAEEEVEVDADCRAA